MLQLSHVDLIWLGEDNGAGDWPLGNVHHIRPDPCDVAAFIDENASGSSAEFWLLWCPSVGAPNPDVIVRVAELPGDVWHAGLRLGMAGLPGIIDFVAPTWMLNRDPAGDKVATSWRISAMACLIRVDVLRQMGGFDPAFESLDTASLEFGHRCITRGVVVRHVPWMVDRTLPPARLPLADEMRFLYNRFQGWQSHWALFRTILSGYAAPWQALRAWSQARSIPPKKSPPPFQRSVPSPVGLPSGRVTVLIPTLDRYSYLRTVLAQLRHQTIPPLEIIVVDQTEPTQRDHGLKSDFADLPLRIFYQDRAGQCSSRNMGLQNAEGEYALLIDDDDEIPADLIESHLRNLRNTSADVSSGVADEIGAGPLPDNFTFTRSSDVFPTNNTLIRLDVLHSSGLFDLAYERGQRADGDLGMRVYLGGALMILEPTIRVLHHHAPRGGLRAHKARVITYASSRTHLFHRHLPSSSESYLAKRYFSPRQEREMFWLRAFGTLSARGGRRRKLLKAIVGSILMPHTLWVIWHRNKAAKQLLATYPQIPDLESEGGGYGLR